MELSSRETERVLRAAGWYPGRRIDVSGWVCELEESGFLMHEAAVEFLSEFGGLRVNVHGPGISCVKEPFELDPLLCLGEDDRFRGWGNTLGKHLAPLGELDHGRFFLGIDAHAVIHLVVDWVASFGPVSEALDRLILGIAADPVNDGRWASR